MSLFKRTETKPSEPEASRFIHLPTSSAYGVLPWKF
jgi:hypothetical protein